MFHFTATRINNSMNGTVDQKIEVFGKMYICLHNRMKPTKHRSYISEWLLLLVRIFVSLLPVFNFFFSSKESNQEKEKKEKKEKYKKEKYKAG